MPFKLSMNLQQATSITGKLSNPSKMPGYGYGIPASLCNVGTKLAKVENSTCKSCYAFKGNYTFPNVKRAQLTRYEAIDQPIWIKAMASNIFINCLIFGNEKHFRWHDSGDIKNVLHLHKIVKIAELLPQIKFWLPTREYKIVGDYVAKYGNNWPENLTIRLSDLMIDGTMPETMLNRLNVVRSSVVTTGNYNCEAYKNKAILGKNACGDCRKCWDMSVPLVSYPKH